jgi:DNA-directed RNA polymerase subunit RPC12/RpoP
MDEVTFCPNCGKTLDDFSVGQRRESAIDWTGKIRCPKCNFFGFFLKISEAEYRKLKFSGKEIKTPVDYSDPEIRMQQEHSNWLAFIIAISVIAALAYFLVASA